MDKKYPLTRFGDVVRNVKESVDLEDRNNGNFLRYIAGGHMQTDDLHLRDWGEINDDYLGPAFHRVFRKGQVLYGSRRTYLRKVAVANFDGVTANTTFVLEPKNEKLKPELLPFIMQSESFVEHSIKNSKGSTNPYITWKDLAKFEFPFPPIPEQRRIAEILWATDGMVESWNVSLHHFYLVEKKLVKEFLYKNGSDLQEYKLGDIISLDYGKGLPQTDRDSGPYAVVGSNGIIDRHSVYQYESPGIVLGRKGAAGNVNWIDEPYWPIDTAYNVRIVENNINFRFLYYLLSTMDLPRFQISTAIPGINREDIYSLKVKIPNIDTQRKIVTILENIEESKNLIISHIEASKQFSKLLLKELLHYV